MGLIEKLRRFFRKSQDEALQSDLKRFDNDLKRSNERFKALQSALNISAHEEKQNEDYYNKGASGLSELSHPLELQKESLQLGVAAGYTGKSIKEIESSLARIESQMTSKEWFTSNFEDRTPELTELLIQIKNTLERHDSNALKRLESIESALNRMVSVAKNVPEPVRGELIQEIESIRSDLPLTSKMKELVEIVKNSGQLSYDDLGAKMGLTVSSLRGLLSNTLKRTDEIERYSVAGKGWVRYKNSKSA